VSVLIASRNRPDDLALTLDDLASQDYRAVEIVVIDDASTESLESIVKEHRPDASFHRRVAATGLCDCRNQLFTLARGEFILQLDDDATLTGPDDITTAVRAMELHREVGVIAFYSYNGPTFPSDFQRGGKQKYGTSFLGAGALFRASALQQADGYTSFFQGHWEEQELCIRLLKHDWACLEMPSLVIHHRVSSINRRATLGWQRGLRNQLWAMVMHMPLRRLPVEFGWKLCLGIMDAVRFFRPYAFLSALVSFLIGLPRVLSLREPMSQIPMRRYDALRFTEIGSIDEWRQPSVRTLRDLWLWFRNTWWNRPRSRPFWSSTKGDLGRSNMNTYASVCAKRSE
jgi:GT2 family glycosyltransferase